MRQFKKLGFDILEDRCNPSTYGNPWPDAAHLTLSFVPDGTLVGSHTSNLFQSLDRIAPTATWQAEILRAFQTWAARANINVSVVADNGAALGTTGAIQSDARFGDIRIAAWASGPGEEGVATPFEFEAGTWSGDVQLNSSTRFSIGGGAGTYDLFSVMVHEAGHVFGLDHHDVDSASVMFEDYVGVRTALGAGDVAGIQDLYGARSPDSFEGAGGNNSLSSATRLNPVNNGNGSLAISVSADITTLQDKDTYSFSAPLAFAAVDITVRTAGNSLLAPSAKVFDSAGRLVTQAVSTSPTQGGFVIHLKNVLPLSTYYVQISGARPDVFGVGSYQLTIYELGLLNNLLGGVTSIVNYGLGAVNNVLLANDLHTNDSFTTATALPAMQAGPSSTYALSYRGSIHDSADIDYFKLQTPAPISGNVFTAMVWGLQGKLDARVRVFDAQHNPVAAQIIVNDGFSYVIQISGAAPQATYYVTVTAANLSGARNVGNYFVGLNLTLHAVVLNDYASGTLGADQPTSTSTLTLSQEQLFHFVLSAEATTATSARVQMTITDASGNVLFTLTAGTNEAVSGDIALNAGTYTVRFTILAAAGSPLSDLIFRLRGNRLTDPIGPESTDPTADPGSSPGSTSPGTVTWSSGNGGGTGVSPQDPTSDPYSSGSTTTETTTTSGGDSSGTYASSDTTTSTSTDTATASAPPPTETTTSSETTHDSPPTEKTSSSSETASSPPTYPTSDEMTSSGSAPPPTATP